MFNLLNFPHNIEDIMEEDDDTGKKKLPSPTVGMLPDNQKKDLKKHNNKLQHAKDKSIDNADMPS